MQQIFLLTTLLLSAIQCHAMQNQANHSLTYKTQHQNPFLHHCIERKDKENALRALKIPHSGRVHDKNVYWLYLFLRENNFKDFRTLLRSPDTDPNANLGAKGKTAMGLAYELNMDDETIVEMHKNHEELKPLLVLAAMYQRDCFVLELLARGVRTDACDEKGNTALHYAANNNDLFLIDMLRSKHEALLNAQNADGQTPLHIAAQAGNYQALQQLISYKKTNCNLTNRLGDTPLHTVIKTFPKHLSKQAVDFCLEHKRFEKIPDNHDRSIPVLLSRYVDLELITQQQNIASMEKLLQKLSIK